MFQALISWQFTKFKMAAITSVKGHMICNFCIAFHSKRSNCYVEYGIILVPTVTFSIKPYQFWTSKPGGFHLTQTYLKIDKMKFDETNGISKLM